jgi:hypothetical protein
VVGAPLERRSVILVPVTDWKALAQARGLSLPAQDLERASAPLGVLERAFRSVKGDLPVDLEPALEFFPSAEDGQ